METCRHESKCVQFHTHAIDGVLCCTCDTSAESVVVYHIISAVLSKWPRPLLVWFLKIVWNSKYLKLHEDRNNWFDFFLFAAGKLLRKTKNVLHAAVQYVPKVRDIITVERDRPQFMFTITSYHSQTVTSFSR